MRRKWRCNPSQTSHNKLTVGTLSVDTVACSIALFEDGELGEPLKETDVPARVANLMRSAAKHCAPTTLKKARCHMSSQLIKIGHSATQFRLYFKNMHDGVEAACGLFGKSGPTVWQLEPDGKSCFHTEPVIVIPGNVCWELPSSACAVIVGY